MAKSWKLKKLYPKELAPVYSAHPPLLAQLLYNRHLETEEAIEKFLIADYEKGLHSPFLFLDMEKVVERIWRAILNGEKICIYGDYDADAVTASAVLRQTFRYLNHQLVTSYIPDRFSEGYGVNLEALEKIKADGTSLIITVDCGTNSTDAAEWALKNNLDFIITDHHEIIGEVPKAYALINPKNPSDKYPYREITGVGVAFKLASAILKNEKCKVQCAKYVEGYEKWLLDLVAIGTVADCHSLVGENRVLVKYGLKVLQKTKWTGLTAIITSAGLDFKKQKPDTYTLGFVLAPRLNAAGRLEHAGIALDVLLEENPNAAAEKAQRLEEINRRRQEMTERIMSEAREQVLAVSDRKFLVLMGEGWSKGVVGLVAGKLAEEFGKPTIVLSREGELATGSARTAGGFNIIEALKFSSHHLNRFGGHEQAAGLTLRAESFSDFYQSVLEFTEANLSSVAGPVLELEAELLPADLQLTTYNLITALEPFGVGNPKPKFLVKDARVVSYKVVGGGKHAQLQLQVSEKIVWAIAFGFGQRVTAFNNQGVYQIACELMVDSFSGVDKLKLRVVDIQPQV